MEHLENRKWTLPAKVITDIAVVRCYKPEDAVILTQSIKESKPHLLPWMPWAANEPEPVDQKRDRLTGFKEQFERGEDFVYGIFAPDESEVIGSTGLHTRQGPDILEIGYWLNPRYTGRGIITKVAGILTRLGLEQNHIEKIQIHCSTENLASKGIPKRLGFQWMGEYPKVEVDSEMHELWEKCDPEIPDAYRLDYSTE